MKVDVRDARGRVAPLAEEVAAVLAVLAMTRSNESAGAVVAPQPVSRWRAAGRAYHD